MKKTLFRQLFDCTSCTYTYLLGDCSSGQCCLIDPVLEHEEFYRTYLKELGLTLVLSIESHTHADHISAGDQLRNNTGCQAMIPKESDAPCGSGYFSEGTTLQIGGTMLECLYTPGHTSDSYCFYDRAGGRLFTGDTLLIRGSGRTDFQNGDAAPGIHQPATSTRLCR